MTHLEAMNILAGELARAEGKTDEVSVGNLREVLSKLRLQLINNPDFRKVWRKFIGFESDKENVRRRDQLAIAALTGFCAGDPRGELEQITLRALLAADLMEKRLA